MKVSVFKSLVVAGALIATSMSASAAPSFTGSSTIGLNDTRFLTSPLPGATFDQTLAFTLSDAGFLDASVAGTGGGAFKFTLFQLESATHAILATGTILANGTKASFSSFDSSYLATAGSYFLHIKGLTAGIANYSGQVSLTAPVPEPETYGMFLAGLGLMGFVARRRKFN